MTLDLSAPALNPDGTPVLKLSPDKNASLSMFLANVLWHERGPTGQDGRRFTFDPVKFDAWARKLSDTDKLELDKADLETLKSWVLCTTGVMAAGIHGPIKSAILALEK